MGKPNPAKLANFPEVEVFVLVADPDGLILDSKVPNSDSFRQVHAAHSFAYAASAVICRWVMSQLSRISFRQAIAGALALA